MTKKNSSQEMKNMIRNMRTGMVVESNNTLKKDVSMRDMLKITRNLNEDMEGGLLSTTPTDENPTADKTNSFDQKREEDKFRAFFSDINVSIKFIPLDVTDNLVFWGGTIDGVIQFIYKVTPDEKTSGVEFNYLKDFTIDNSENQEIIDRVESYYDSFYKYWRNNILEP